MKKYSKQDKKLIAIWAAKCAEKVLPIFEMLNFSKENLACSRTTAKLNKRPAVLDKYSKDNRPRRAIETIRNCVKTDTPKISIIRKISLDAHAAAREMKENNSACFAARSADQAVATAHVTQHAFGASWYALKAIKETNPEKLKEEYNWQLNQLPEHLRKIFLKIVIIKKVKNKITIKIIKGKGF